MIQPVASTPLPQTATRGTAAANDRQQQAEIAALAQRDRAVRAHEQAHISAGGMYVTGGPTFQYQTGPDGKRYAVGGEVSIDVSPERTPQATLDKANTVYRAALAPADPSAQDRAVAAAAAQMAATAERELAQQRGASAQGGGVALVPLASPLGTRIDTSA